jgi:hypothetical protein
MGKDGRDQNKARKKKLKSFEETVAVGETKTRDGGDGMLSYR